ncbi:MAG: DeoR family transcriptional regulator [Patescibacteria group bacterium]
MEMDKNNLIRITTNLYRLTLLFPKKESLRYKTREVANDILALGILIFDSESNNVKKEISEDKKHIEILDSYLELAKAQNWVSPHDILTIQEEYKVMMAKLNALSFNAIKSEKKQEIKIEEEDNKELKIKLVKEEDGSKEDRCEKIKNILKERGKAQVGDIKNIFPNISKRTLRRDFEYLVNIGSIERLGENNTTFYQLSRT